MALIQTLLTLVLRRAGRLLNTLFGWATTLLFGKVPEKRQLYLSIVALGSVLWLVVVVGIAFPSVATFLLAFVTLPDWVEPMWIRLAMLVASVVLPLVVGVVSLFLVDPEQRGHGAKEIIKSILRGYPYTIGLAVTLVMMLVTAPILKLQNIWRRWKAQHVPVVVEPEDYMAVVGDLQGALRKAGIATERVPASPLLRWPTQVFTWFVKGGIEDLVADELTTLRASHLHVIVHPSDLLLRGREREVSRAFAVILESLAFTKCYMTWTKEAREFEDRFERLIGRAESHDHVTSHMVDEFRQIADDLKQVKVSSEELEVLLRIKLQTERNLLRKMAGVENLDRDQVAAEPENVPAIDDQSQPRKKKQRPSPAILNTTAVVMGLITWARRGRKAAPQKTV